MHISFNISWQELAKSLGRSLQLHMVALSSTSNKVSMDSTGDAYFDNERTYDAACSLMQRLADRFLGVKSHQGGVFAWHKQDSSRRTHLTQFPNSFMGSH